jgi:hypothetical protein
MGEKAPRSEGGRRVLDTWRFTSSDVTALEQVAALYGGTVEEWPDTTSPHTHQLTTKANEIRVALPPDACTESNYTLWVKGALKRSCDGETVELRTVTQGPEGDVVHTREADCVCWAKQVMECSQREVRLDVLLPEIRFAGTWVYKSKAAAAVAEIPASVDVIRLAQAQGLPFASLRIEKRRSTDFSGNVQHFSVAVLGSEFSIEQIAAGGLAAVGAAPGREDMALPAGMAYPEAVDVSSTDRDGQVVDGEVVEESTGEGPVEVESVAPPSAEPHPCPGCGFSTRDGRPIRRTPQGYAHVECIEPSS